MRAFWIGDSRENDIAACRAVSAVLRLGLEMVRLREAATARQGEAEYGGKRPDGANPCDFAPYNRGRDAEKAGTATERRGYKQEGNIWRSREGLPQMCHTTKRTHFIFWDFRVHYIYLYGLMKVAVAFANGFVLEKRTQFGTVIDG